MVKHLLLAASAACFLSSANAQQVANFENLTLGTDTFYLNLDTNGYSFNSGQITLFGKFTQETWGIGGQGFTYSNRVDTAQCLTCYDLDYQMANRPGGGAENSSNYAIAFAYEPVGLRLHPTPTNNSIKPGSASFANSSWGYAYANATYNEANEGWAKLIIKGYHGNAIPIGDSIEVFLADFRASTPAADKGVLNDWKSVSLLPLLTADSLSFTVKSSDDFFPAYFALDNFETVSAVSLSKIKSIEAKIYPNPTTSIVNIEYTEPLNMIVVDMMGKQVLKINNSNSIDMSQLAAGQYLIHLSTKDGAKSSVVNVSKL